jgi:hypothetical protein
VEQVWGNLEAAWALTFGVKGWRWWHEVGGGGEAREGEGEKPWER